MLRRWPFAVLAVIATTAARPARAEAAEPETTRAPGARMHDGFYARLAAGVTVIRDSYEARGDTGWLFGESSGTVTGFGQSHEIAVGGSVAPGLALAGVVVMDIARTTSAEYTGGPVHPNDGYALASFGLLVDFYPDPLGGFHVQGGGGLAAVSGVQPEGVEGGSGTGYGLFAGTGYEWWIAEQWALGGLLRLQYVAADESGFAVFDTLEVKHRAIAVSLLFTATYN